MKTILERAARALCRLDGHPEDVKMAGKPMWQDYLPEARAVLEAIREPDDKMFKLPLIWRESSDDEIWVAIIDKALAEEPPTR